ncbi:MAG: hypothetical protein ACK5PZ_02530, partial [Pirellula sp.]
MPNPQMPATHHTPSSTATGDWHSARANSWQLSRDRLDLGPVPLVMGILNVTPDSFSDGGRFY